MSGHGNAWSGRVRHAAPSKRRAGPETAASTTALLHALSGRSRAVANRRCTGAPLEWAARNARRYGAIVGLSGGLIGPDDTPRDYPGSFDQTPVFLGCSDVDPYIAKERVLDAAEVFKRMGAAVTVRLYPGMGHMVGAEEIAIVRGLVEAI